jgi:hypothetical protein
VHGATSLSEGIAGLLTDLYVALGVITFSVTLFEVNRRLKRRRISPQSKGTSEEMAMAGYLYSARCYVPFKPTPPLSKWPLLWIWDVIKVPDFAYIERTNLDAATYVRVLKGCLYFSTFHACTVLPTLLTLHLHYSPDSFAKTDINRASLSALVTDRANSHLLWVHVVCLWILTLSECPYSFRSGMNVTV